MGARARGHILECGSVLPLWGTENTYLRRVARSNGTHGFIRIRIHNMWIVRLALRWPYSFTVMAILIVLVGVVTITRMSTDIFPNINIPVVSVIWSYAGVAPEEMEKRFVTVSARAMTTTVNDIEHIESQSYNGGKASRWK